MHAHVHPIILACTAYGQSVKVMESDTKALSEELRSSEKRECRWSKGKGTWLDTERSGFESQSALKPFLLYIYLLQEKI